MAYKSLFDTEECKEIQKNLLEEEAKVFHSEYYNDDCLKVLKEMKDNYVDVTVTSNYSWTASLGLGASGFSISPSSGDGDGRIRITASGNGGDSEATTIGRGSAQPEGTQTAEDDYHCDFGSVSGVVQLRGFHALSVAILMVKG